MQDKEESLVGRRIFGEYTFDKKLGEGGMGAVYLAHHSEIDQQVAVKVLHSKSARSDELLKRFAREARVVAMLSHPNIIRVFIFGKDQDGMIYMAMEYVDGGSLRELLLKGPLQEKRAIKIAKQALSAMAEAHDLGIVHRDLKPDNILLTEFRGEADYVKVLDFGIAKIKQADDAPTEQKLTQAGVVYGTPEYLSPEQAQAGDLDQRTDIYSMGVILYEMLTGQVPFTAPSAVTILTMHVFEEPPRPREINGTVSPEMEAIILKAMSKNPDDRYATAMEFFEALSSREWELVQQGGFAPSMVPGQELIESTIRQSRGGGQNARTMAVDLDASVVPDDDSGQSSGSGMRKLLVGAIVFALFILLALGGVIIALLLMKSH